MMVGSSQSISPYHHHNLPLDSTCLDTSWTFPGCRPSQTWLCQAARQDQCENGNAPLVIAGKRFHLKLLEAAGDAPGFPESHRRSRTGLCGVESGVHCSFRCFGYHMVPLFTDTTRAVDENGTTMLARFNTKTYHGCGTSAR